MKQENFEKMFAALVRYMQNEKDAYYQKKYSKFLALDVEKQMHSVKTVLSCYYEMFQDDEETDMLNICLGTTEGKPVYGYAGKDYPVQIGEKQILAGDIWAKHHSAAVVSFVRAKYYKKTGELLKTPVSDKKIFAENEFYGNDMLEVFLKGQK